MHDADQTTQGRVERFVVATHHILYKCASLPYELSFLIRWQMRYLAGWLLLAIGGNASPTSDQIKELFDTVGVGYDEERAEQVVAELKGKDVDDVGQMLSLGSCPDGLV